MQTGIILAGGLSSRMGQDKSLINSNVSRLANELRSAGCSRIIVMCGTAERMDLFEEECVIDSKETLAESLYDFISQLTGKIQLAPCDAYLADADLFSKIDGVPTDDLGNRQPLLAKFDTNKVLREVCKSLRNVSRRKVLRRRNKKLGTPILQKNSRRFYLT